MFAPRRPRRKMRHGPIAGEWHRLRADILAQLGRPEDAEGERLRSVEHYVVTASGGK
jgi:hypothetical protein